jgi:hypothetical protein
MEPQQKTLIDITETATIDITDSVICDSPDATEAATNSITEAATNSITETATIDITIFSQAGTTRTTSWKDIHPKDAITIIMKIQHFETMVEPLVAWGVSLGLTRNGLEIISQQPCQHVQSAPSSVLVLTIIHADLYVFLPETELN